VRLTRLRALVASMLRATCAARRLPNLRSAGRASAGLLVLLTAYDLTLHLLSLLHRGYNPPTGPFTIPYNTFWITFWGLGLTLSSILFTQSLREQRGPTGG